MKNIIVKQLKNPTGFGKPTLKEYEGVEFGQGKVAIEDERGYILVYSTRTDATEVLSRNGKTWIEEKSEA
jgi:hypothetical protein